MALVIRKSTHTASGKPMCGGAMGSGQDNIVPPTGTVHGIFDEISKVENNTGTTDYRCVYIENPRDSVEPAGSPRVRILSTSDAEIALGPVSKNTQAESISDENTPPSAISFTTQDQIAKSSSDGYLRFPGTSQLLPGEWAALWIRRKTKASNGSGTMTEELVLDIQWDE